MISKKRACLRLLACWMAGVCVGLAGCATVTSSEKVPDKADSSTFGKKVVERVRRTEPAKTPEWVNRIPDRVGDILIEKQWYKQGPVWGLAKRGPDDKLNYDEAGSLTFLGLAGRFNLWDRLPVLDEAAKQKALAFWQSWQDPETGLFKDPRDPDRRVNEKYVVFLIEQLGGKCLYHRKQSIQSVAKDASGKFDTSKFLELTRNAPDWEEGGWGVGSRTGWMAVELFKAINNDGQMELIGDLQKGIEQILSHQDPKSGLWGPPSASLPGRLGGTLKVISRLYFQMGMKVPHTKELADSLISHSKNGDWFSCGGGFCVPQNVAIMVGYCLEVSDYRREELLGVLDSLVNDYHHHWVNPDGSMMTRRDDQSSIGIEHVHIQAMGIIGAYLHWTDCRLPNTFEGHPRGVGYRYKFVVDNDGKVRFVDTTMLGGYGGY